MNNKVFLPVTLLLSMILCTGVFAQKISGPRSIKAEPVIAQPIKAAPIKAEPVSRQTAVMGDIKVYVDGTNGAVVSWQTSYERGNVGFNVYRLEGGGRTPVNNSVIGGSLIRVGEKNELNGQTYTAFDPQGRADTAYYVETLDMYGRKALYGPVAPVYTADVRTIKGYNERLAPGYQGADPSQILESGPAPEKPMGALRGGINARMQAAPESDPVNQHWVASQPGVKIKVNKTGIYHISKTQLMTAGFDVDAASQNWQLYLNGVQQKMIVEPSGNFIEFYGEGIDIQNADFQMYYLIAAATPGARIPEIGRIPIGPFIIGQSFRNVVKYEPREAYVGAQIVNGDLDNWFGPVIANGSTTTRNMNLKDIDTESADVSIEIAVHGLINSTHKIQATLNGQILGTLDFAGISPSTKSYSIKASTLHEGANTLEFTALGGPSDFCVFDYVSIDYWRLFKADQNALAFEAQSLQRTNVTGFNSPNIRVFDFDFNNEVELITNVSVSPGTGGNFDVSIPQGRKTKMIAVNENSLLSPVSITSNAPSTLTTTSTADMAIISYGNFMVQANNWADYRRGQGLTVDVVNVEDVFDEFDYGLPTPTAMKNYIVAAKAANSNLKYVMMIGDATYDPRNYLGLGYNDLIPTKFVDTSEGESPSDEFLGDANGDGVAELALGRVAVRDGASVTQILGKVTSYEAALTPTSLMTRGLLFVSDDPVGWDFVAMSHRLRDELPAAMPVTFVNAPDEGNPAVIRQQIITAVNAGPLFANYAGHGSTRVWSSRQFLRFTPNAPATNDLLGLTNSAGDKLSVFLMLTCLNGYFVDPTDDSIAEGVVRISNGGAPTSWASTGSTTPNIQEEMADVFFQLLGQGTYQRLGDATHAAKLSATSPEVPLTWAIIGDPALKIK
jgi:hypothetical protein